MTIEKRKRGMIFVYVVFTSTSYTLIKSDPFRFLESTNKPQTKTSY